MLEHTLAAQVLFIVGLPTSSPLDLLCAAPDACVARQIMIATAALHRSQNKQPRVNTRGILIRPVARCCSRNHLAPRRCSVLVVPVRDRQTPEDRATLIELLSAYINAVGKVMFPPSQKNFIAMIFAIPLLYNPRPTSHITDPTIGTRAPSA